MKTFRKIIAISLSVIIMLAAASARYEKTDKKKEDEVSFELDGIQDQRQTTMTRACTRQLINIVFLVDAAR